jgi:hypothetical protein
MTNREFFDAIANYEGMDEEIVAHAQAEIEKLDATNEKRREANAKKALEKEAERAPIRNAIVACLTVEPKTATTLIAEAGVEIKPQAMPSLMKGLVEAGTVVKTQVKVTGKGKQVGYALAPTDTDAE